MIQQSISSRQFVPFAIEAMKNIGIPDDCPENIDRILDIHKGYESRYHRKGRWGFRITFRRELGDKRYALAVVGVELRRRTLKEFNGSTLYVEGWTHDVLVNVRNKTIDDLGAEEAVEYADFYSVVSEFAHKLKKALESMSYEHETTWVEC